MVPLVLLYLIPAVLVFAFTKIEMDYGPVTIGHRAIFSLLWPFLLIHIFSNGKFKK